MAWTDVNFAEVNPGTELIPKGDYTFLVQTAQRGQFDQNDVNVRMNVANPGPYQGQTVYLRFPNPDKAGKGVPGSDPRNWVNKVWKVFENATGYAMNPGEHPVDFVVRIAKNAESKGEHIYVEGRIDHETYNDKDSGEPVTRHKVVPRSIRPLAEETKS